MLPAGGPRGQSTQIKIDGKNLAGARLFVNGGGIVIKSQQVNPAGDALTAELTVDGTARLGPHEARLATPKGVSGGLRFWVDLYPNRVLDQPMSEGTPPLELDGAAPAVINGRIAAKAGRDRFTLMANAGDTWVFDCFADRIRSRFDPVLELRDEAGISLQLVESTWENDPRFCYKFVKAGRYFLNVRDSEYNGGPNYTYRLLAGRMGFVAGYAPRSARPGQQIPLTLEGTNLPGTTATVTVPADAPMGTFWAPVNTGSGAPYLLPLQIGTEKVLEAGAGETARALPAMPVAVNGLFARSSRAHFPFHAVAKTKYLFDLLGRRLGSRIDGEINVLDATGKTIATNDDAPGLGKDAQLTFEAPATGEYTLEVRNVEEVTGPTCFYTLKARTVTPDFSVAIATDRLTVPIGGTVVVPITLTRLGGYNGPVEIRGENLPAGVELHGGLIPAGKNSVDVTLTAAPNAVFTGADSRLVGQATIEGKAIMHAAPGWERYEHRSIDLLLSVEYSYERPHHLWDLLLLAITDRVDPITVSAPMTPLTLAPGGKIEIPVHLAREASAKGEIKLDVRGLPAKVTATSAPIPAGQTEGKIVLTAAPDAAPDTTNILLQAHHDKSLALSPAIQISVVKK